MLRWKSPEAGRQTRATARAIAERHALEEAVALGLAARGETPDSVQDLLRPVPARERAPDEVIAVASAINARLQQGEVGILCDYDVDGACAAAILTRAVREIAPEDRVPREVPERNTEGFGPNRRCLDALAAAGAGTVLVLDCGTDRGALLEAFRVEHQALVAVVDHHPAPPQARPPPPALLLNPHADGPERLRGACTGRLALEVARELLGLYGRWQGPVREEIVWLAGLATACDVMPVRDPANRALIQACTRLAPPPGVAELLPEGQTRCTARDLGWTVGPALNAGSRMGRSAAAATLLCTANAEERTDAADRLLGLNEERKREGRRTRAALEPDAARHARGPINMVVCPQASPGTAGVVAGRLVHEHGWPCVALAPDPKDPEERLAGSGRSALGFDLGNAVRAAVDAGLVLHGGGHPAACGLAVTRTQVEPLRAFLVERLRAERPDAVPTIAPDVRLNGADLRRLRHLVAGLDQLEPWGNGLDPLLCEVPGAQVLEVNERGAGHVFLRVRCDGAVLDAVRWGSPPGWTERLRAEAAAEHPVDLAGTLEAWRWAGREGIRLNVRRVRRSV